MNYAKLEWRSPGDDGNRPLDFYDSIQLLLHLNFSLLARGMHAHTTRHLTLQRILVRQHSFVPARYAGRRARGPFTMPGLGLAQRLQRSVCMHPYYIHFPSFIFSNCQPV